LHERTGVGSDLYAQLIERAIRSAETITGGIRQGQGSLFASLSNVLELKALFVKGEALAVSQVEVVPSHGGPILRGWLQARRVGPLVKVRCCVSLACSPQHLLTVCARWNLRSLLADLFRPISEAIFEGYCLLVTTPLQHGAAPWLGAGGSAIGLSATGAYENVTLPAVKGECPAARMVAMVREEMRVISAG
jgi:hypothetical protein